MILMQNLTTTKLTYDLIFAETFSDELISWFQTNARKLSFRETKDPYKIWISEIMAQQTQIDTLLPYYERFVARFPTPTALAGASEDEVLKLWEGLGYYSRARNLHKAAKIIAADYAGAMPRTYTQLIKLPGIGPYTAGAIASIAFGEKVPAVDGNVLRVVARVNNYGGDIAAAQTKKEVTVWLTEVMPEAAGDFNEGLMELGALVCTPTNPRCLLCPVQNICAAFRAGTTDELPVKTKKAKQKTIQLEVGLVYRGDSLLLVKRAAKGLLARLWGFPSVEAESDAPGEAIRRASAANFPDVGRPEFVGEARHVFTHIIWEMKVYRFDLDEAIVAEELAPYGDEEGIFVSPNQLADYTLPVAFSKLLTL